VAGLLGRDHGLLRARPFRAPHHSASRAALLGGGDPIRPGEISLAHLGCLFLDELPEYARATLEGLREPLESGRISVCRARSRATFPARALLVGAFNPCPCGYAEDPRGRCRCSVARVQAYRDRLSGPLLDRFDVQLCLRALSMDELSSRTPGESSRVVAERVARARDLQRDRRRCGETSVALNAALDGPELDRVASLDAAGLRLVREAVDRLGLSARGYTKARRVARTIADLAGADAIAAHHVAEALDCRPLDRRGRDASATAA
jgi:magnesium chelatase family protein